MGRESMGLGDRIPEGLMSRVRFSAAQLHGSPMAARLPKSERAALGIESDEELNARVARDGERELQRQCENLLRLRGIPFIHLSARAREKAGWPDLSFPLPPSGRFVAVELKRPGGKLSGEQVRILADLEATGAVVRTCRTFAEFRAVLDAEK